MRTAHCWTSAEKIKENTVIKRLLDFIAFFPFFFFAFFPPYISSGFFCQFFSNIMVNQLLIKEETRVPVGKQLRSVSLKHNPR